MVKVFIQKSIFVLFEIRKICCMATNDQKYSSRWYHDHNTFNSLYKIGNRVYNVILGV
jgi:hypothetical protein